MAYYSCTNTISPFHFIKLTPDQPLSQVEKELQKIYKCKLYYSKKKISQIIENFPITSVICAFADNTCGQKVYQVYFFHWKAKSAKLLYFLFDIHAKANQFLNIDYANKTADSKSIDDLADFIFFTFEFVNDKQETRNIKCSVAVSSPIYSDNSRMQKFQ